MFGNVVREARVARGLSQADLAGISGIAQANISAIENDRREPSARTLHHLLTACGFEVVARSASDLVRFPVGDDSKADVLDVLPPPKPRSARERARTIAAVLEVSETIVRSKARR